MTAQNILEVKNLTKVFDQDLFKKKQIVLDNLSLSFPQGSCTAFMGHNGAGKTTTIRTIFGLIRPDKGEILFKGQPLRLADKKRIGYMPETNKLPLNLSCEEVLSHQLRVFNPPDLKPKHFKDRIEKQLRDVELWDHRTKWVGKLSKGMGRRLSWAQATIHKPELIVLDEPMSGLDPLGYRLMMNLINAIHDEGTSIILCTHELWSIRELCDHAHIIKKGRLIYSSLDPEKSGNPPLQHFLAISGTDIDTMKTLQKTRNLSMWSEFRCQAHRIDFWFNDYADAVKWLETCLKQGILIIDFKKASQFDETHLIRYFGEEKIG